MRWFIPRLSVWASPLTNLEEHFGTLCQLEISTSKEHLFLLIKSHGFKIFPIISPMTCPAEQQHPELSTQATHPQGDLQGRAVVVWSCPALPGDVTPGENQTSTTDDSTDQLTGHTLPKSSTHPWVSTFSVRDFPEDFQGKNLSWWCSILQKHSGKAPGRPAHSWQVTSSHFPLVIPGGR